MVTMGFVVKDGFNGRLEGGEDKHTADATANDSDARVDYVPCTDSRLERTHRVKL
jgi:hypothetical protein